MSSPMELEQVENTFLDKSTTFDTMCNKVLSRQLCYALDSNFGFKHPSLVQSKVIPLYLQGKDILLRAQTGSGKTLAYAVPITHKLIQDQSDCAVSKLECAVLVPTKELCRQVSAVFSSLCSFISSSAKFSIRDTAGDLYKLSQSPCPRILIATPKSFIQYTTSRANQSKVDIAEIVSRVKHIVMDEADLLVELGYQPELEQFFRSIVGVKKKQTIICSATINPKVEYFTNLALHKPHILELTQPVSSTQQQQIIPSKLSQYYFTCAPSDKFLVLYALLELSLLPLKCLIYVNTINQAYKLGHFLEKFSIQSSIIFAEAPFKSRLTFVNSFNQGLIQILIIADGTTDQPEVVTKSKKKRKRDSEFGAQRGMDFKDVSCVVNFDVPVTVESYIHRIGRTARAGQSGYALTLYSDDQSAESSHFRSILNSIKASDIPLNPLDITLEDVQCFRYRVNDVLKTITPKVVAELQTHDIQKQFLKSKVIQEHLKSGKEDSEELRAAFQQLQRAPAQQSKHLAVRPGYLNPQINGVMCTENSVEAVIHRLQEPQESSHPTIGTKLVIPARTSYKKRVITSLLQRNLKKKVDYAMTAPEQLPPLSGRKLYKLRKGRPLTKRRHSVHVNILSKKKRKQLRIRKSST